VGVLEPRNQAACPAKMRKKPDACCGQWQPELAQEHRLPDVGRLYRHIHRVAD